ncbi:MAG: chlorite dismutase [Acidimicrobiaceae bacterium]|nr:chlorite dismutase [Acidimicrobiaceae bacterium]
MSVNESPDEEIVPGIPKEGWSVLHLFFHVGPEVDSDGAAKALKTLSGDGYQVVTATLIGHKADFAVMALGPDLSRLRSLQSELGACGLSLVYSYFSLTEVSEYAKGLSEDRRNPRLYPVLPPSGKRVFCFYPMSKRREIGANWYMLSYEKREQEMAGHGSSGRKFSGRIVQLITGSTGLDGFEWGVTLFGQRIDDIKDVVYTLRFDEVSAVYAEFGPFYVGIIDEPGPALAACTAGKG